MRARLALMALLTVLAPAAPVAGQSLSQRVAAVPTGTLRLSFATRAMVCGTGDFIGFDLPDAFRSYTMWDRGYSINVLRDVRPDCRTGLLRLVVVKTGGAVSELRAAVGVAWRPSDTATDLGTVSAPDAAAWLLDLAEASADDDVARTAFLAAAAAAAPGSVDRVLGMARNTRRSVETRIRAVRWAGVIGAAEGRTEVVDAALRAIAAEPQQPTALRDRAIRELSPSAGNRAHLRSLYGRLQETDLRERILREVAAGGSDDEAAWLRHVALDGTERLPLRARALRLLGEELRRLADVRALYAQLTEPALQERALRIVADAGDRATLGWVREVAEARDERVSLRDRALRLLAAHGEFGILREMYPRLDRIVLKERVLRVAAESGDAASAAWLATIVLDDGELSELRERAVRSLDEADFASRELATLYDRVTSRTVRSRLIRVLADRRDQVAAEKLAAIAIGDPDAGLRREAERRQR